MAPSWAAGVSTRVRKRTMASAWRPSARAERGVCDLVQSGQDAAGRSGRRQWGGGPDSGPLAQELQPGELGGEGQLAPAELGEDRQGLIVKDSRRMGGAFVQAGEALAVPGAAEVSA